MKTSAKIKRMVTKQTPVQVTGPEMSEKRDLKLAEMQTRVDELNSLVTTLRKRTKEEGRALLQAAIDKHGVEPVDELLKMATAQDEAGEYLLTTNLRVKILLELAEYRIPKVKTSEVHHDHEHNFNVRIHSFDGNGPAIDVTPRAPETTLL